MTFITFIYSTIIVLLFILPHNGLSLNAAVGRSYDRKTFKEKQPSQNGPVQSQSPENPSASLPSQTSGSTQDFLGPGVKLQNYDSSVYEFRNGGPVPFVEEMSTDFRLSKCYMNVQGNALNWQKATGAPDNKKIQLLFGTATSPGDNYLVAYSSTPRKPTDSAKFESCSVSCVLGDLQFRVKYWASSGVNIKVCNREVFFNDEEPTNCQTLPTQQQPGPATLVFSKLKDVSVFDIIANNFVGPNGGVAIIDDIKVIYTPCSDPFANTPQQSIVTPVPMSVISQPGASDKPTTCQNVVCPFQQNFCNYQDFQDLGKPNVKKFTLESGWYNNRGTGVRPGPTEGKKYAATYLSRRETAGLQSGPLELTGDRLLEFYYYIATQNITIQICYDIEVNCGVRVGGDVQPDARQWKIAAVPVPRQTRRIFIVTQNSGLNEGGVGITDIKLLTPDSPNSVTGSTSSDESLRDVGSLPQPQPQVQQVNPFFGPAKPLPFRKSATAG